MTENKEVKTKKNPGKFISSTGKRKTAVARIRLFDKGKGEIKINDKDLKEYFPTLELQKIVQAPLTLTNLLEKTNFTILVKGGGKNCQAEAIRHGIARALEKLNQDLRKTLKVAGFLKRDARIKERKKPGLKRARRAPQWKKR